MKDETLSYPYKRIQTSSIEQTPDQSLLDDGWILTHYDRYEAIYRYEKVVDIRTILNEIEFNFIKRNEDRDITCLGVSYEHIHGKYSIGTYRYKIPIEFLEELAILEYDKKPLTEELKNILITTLAKNIIDDEFNALLELKKIHNEELIKAIDKNLSRNNQKIKFKKVINLIKKNPTYRKMISQRTRIMIENNILELTESLFGECEWPKMLTKEEYNKIFKSRN